MKNFLSILILLLSLSTNSQPIANFSTNSPTNTFCFGDTIFFQNTSQNYVLSYWNFGDGNFTWTQNPRYIYLMPGTFTVVLKIYDNDGNSVSISKQVTVNPSPDVKIINNTNTKTLIAAATGGAVLKFNWYFNNIQTSDTSQQIYYFESGLYSVKVTNEYNCTDSTAITIDLGNDSASNSDTLSIEVQNNILTPDNADGVNDVLFIKNLNSYRAPCKVLIFNQWGRIVYTNDNYTNLGGFNGTDNNGVKLPAGTYYYIITSTGRKTTTGYIDLIR